MLSDKPDVQVFTGTNAEGIFFKMANGQYFEGFDGRIYQMADSQLAGEIQQLIEDAKRIQESPMGFFSNRQQVLSHWLGQSASN